MLPTLTTRIHSDLWLLKNRGLDAVIYLMLVRHCFYAMFPITMLEFLVLVPVYATATSAVNGTSGLNLISLANVGDTDRLWAPLVVVIVNSLWCFVVFYRLYYLVTAKRIQHRSLRRIENYTVLLREIPPKATAQDIGDHIDHLLGGNRVLSVVIALDSKHLPGLCEQRGKALRELERCMALNVQHPDRRAMVWRGSRILARILSFFRARVALEDGEDYWRRQLQSLDERIARSQGKKRDGCGVAFVTMKSICSAQLLWQSVVHGGDFNHGR